MNIVMNENVSVPDDVVQFVHETLEEVYNYSGMLVSECFFNNDYEKNKHIYKATIIKDNIYYFPFDFDGQHVYDFFDDNIYNVIYSYQNCQVSFVLKNINHVFINYIKQLFPDNTEHLMFSLKNDEHEKDWNKSLFILQTIAVSGISQYQDFNNRNTHKFIKTIIVCGIEVDIYEKQKLTQNQKNFIRVTLTKDGCAYIKDNSSTIQKIIINTPDTLVHDFNKYKISKKEHYKTNPIALNRMDKWTIGF